MNSMSRFLLIAFAMLLSTTYLFGQTKVYRFSIADAIAAPTWRITKEVLIEADSVNADVLFLELDTYGGQVDMADSIRTALLRSEIPVYVLIKNNAASAGALISLACDSIYMQPGSTIGAATVVDQSGTPVPDKYQSYMRSKMRATAEENGRNPDIAEAMVDPDKFVPGVSDSGKVLTFTTSEAIANGFCDGEAKTMDEALKLAGITDFSVTTYKPTDIDKVIGWLINPAVSGVLILIMLGGIYFELQTPGIGFPIAASFIAALLFFAPYYLEGLAENWEILLFFAGILLMAAEVFVIPGFGVAGASGIVLMVAALILSMVGNVGFNFEPVDGTALFTSAATVLTSLSLSIVGVIALGLKLLQSPMFSKLILKAEQNANEGYVSNAELDHSWKGKTGVASTDLRPAGKVSINGKLKDAITEEGYIESGSKVLITGISNAQLKVILHTSE